MIKNKLFLFSIFVIVQLLIVGGLFAQRLFTLSTGNEVELRTVPVDPRDFFRGDYINLRYEISSVGEYLLRGEEVQVGDVVYVTLEQSFGQEYWEAIRVSATPPGDYSAVIRGRVTSVPREDGSFGFISPRNIEIEYGIEKYFVEAGKGRELERSGMLKVVVKLDRSGGAVIERVEAIENQPLTTQVQRRAADTSMRANLMNIRVNAELFYDRTGGYGEPFTFATCPLAGTSMFASDESIREVVSAVFNAAPVRSDVRCAAGGVNLSLPATSWAMSSTLHEGGSWCVDSTGVARIGSASGGGTAPAVCR